MTVEQENEPLVVCISLEDILWGYAKCEITKKGLVAFYLKIYQEFIPGISESDDMAAAAKLGITEYEFTELVAIIEKEKDYSSLVNGLS
jgi:hypothetical protein